MRAWTGLLALSLSAAFCQNPTISIGGIVDAASYSPGRALAPGGLVAIFGTDLAATLTVADTIPLATRLADVSVRFNDIPAPMLAAIPAGPGNPSQVNVQLPWNVLPAGQTTGTATVVVSRGSVSSPPAQVAIGANSPGIFAYPSGVGQAIAVLQTNDQRNGSLAAPVDSIPGIACAPATAGDFLQIYATGLGAVDIPIASGVISTDQIRRTVTTPIVLVGGVAAPVPFSGLSPYFVGVNQINFQIPAGAPKGNAVPLQLQMGDITTTNQVTIAIQ